MNSSQLHFSINFDIHQFLTTLILINFLQHKFLSISYTIHYVGEFYTDLQFLIFCIIVYTSQWL